MACGQPHSYPSIDKTKIDKIINALTSNGGHVQGTNPWVVDTNKHGIVLRGAWTESTSTLTVEVLKKDFFVPCSMIWEKIDPMIEQIANKQVS